MQNVRPLVQIVHVSDLGLTARDGAVVPDRFAAAAFGRFVLALTASDAVWRKHPAWFIASQVTRLRGVVNDAEQHAALDLLDVIAPRTAFTARIVLPGPDEPRHLAHTSVRWPAPPVIERTVDARTEVQLFAVDTHDGAIDPDSLSRLAALAALHRGDRQTTPVRIVVSHHPLPAIAREPARRVPGPLAHLHLAAHTPREEPSGENAWPSLVTPGAWSRGETPWSGSATVLRLYGAPGQPGVIVCERFVATRAAATGRWGLRSDELGVAIREWVLRG